MKFVFLKLVFCFNLLQIQEVISEENFCELFVLIMEDINNDIGSLEYGYVLDEELKFTRSYFDYKNQLMFLISTNSIFFSNYSLESIMKKLKEDTLYSVSNYTTSSGDIQCVFNDTFRYQLIRGNMNNVEYKDTFIVNTKDTLLFSSSKIGFSKAYYVDTKYIFIATVYTFGVQFHRRYARYYLFKKKNNKWTIKSVISESA